MSEPSSRHLRVGTDPRGSACWEVADDQGRTVEQHASGREAAEACGERREEEEQK
jgi:hypothetical protein